MGLTVRQNMTALLHGRELSLEDLCEALDLNPFEALDHLTHLKHSLKNDLQVRPAQCRGCGFVFSRRSRLDPPGRCPRCKAQRIDGPWFSVRA